MEKRVHYALIILVIVSLGLASRKFSAAGSWIHLYMGDVLWAMLFYFIFRFLMVYKSMKIIFLYTLTWCFCVEISQLYHTPWLDAIRQTTIGGLLLGFGFLWSDIGAYSVGTLAGFVIDHFLWRSRIGD